MQTELLNNNRTVRNTEYVMGKGKGKGHPRTGHEGPEREQTYISTLSLTSALDGVGGQHHGPAALPPKKTLYPLYEGGNFNFGNAAVTFDTAHLQSSYFHRPSMCSPKSCRTRSQR